MIILLILTTLSLDNVWILLGEIVDHYWHNFIMIDFVSYNSGSNLASLASLNYKPDYPWIVHELYLKSQVWFRPKVHNTKFNNYCFFSSCNTFFFLTVILAWSLAFLSWSSLVLKIENFCYVVLRMWNSMQGTCGFLHICYLLFDYDVHHWLCVTNIHQN